MIELNKEELNNISGGIALRSKILIVGGVVAFIIGIIDGFTNPNKCNR